jgi:hypothetical protein
VPPYVGFELATRRFEPRRDGVKVRTEGRGSFRDAEPFHFHEHEHGALVRRKAIE